jgi:hypothetical protein
MKTATYLKVCAGVSALWILGLLFVPPFAQAIEGIMLLFLSTQAR